jgi:HlyD family secretion protein
VTGFLCALPVVAWLLSCAAPDVLAVGYVEGEYVNLAPVTTAELTEVAVRQGDRVTAGMVVARQERADAEIALAEAEAARGQAEAELADLREGSRPEEIRVIEAALEAARARFREADRRAERQTALASTGIVSEANLEQAVADRDTARSEIAQHEAELAVARLSAREGVVAAAEAKAKGADAAVRAAAWQLDQRDLVAPVAGEVADVFRRTGEIAGPTDPVVSILPDGAYKLVVFVGETAIAGLAPGTELSVRCDGCPPNLTATVSYVSDEPEFTPPVIYSVENRQKLVYRVEARPPPDGHALRPGQIVDVALR